ncbi:MAG: translation elongation factor-like protein [candidate division NC10 bacterium]|nr:translation elongation factor-like protein [candidate division NC10 bacterium]
MNEVEVGRVARYFGKVGVAVIEIHAGDLHVGDTIRIRGKTTDVSQRVESMEMEHQPIHTAVLGQLVGIKVRERVREHDLVYKEIPQG